MYTKQSAVNISMGLKKGIAMQSIWSSSQSHGELITPTARKIKTRYLLR